MKFFSLSCSVGDYEAALQEVTSYMKDSVDTLSSNQNSALSSDSFRICKFDLTIPPIKHTKDGMVLDLFLKSLEDDPYTYRHCHTRFHNHVALDMYNAIKNLKISHSDIIVLRRPTKHLNSKGDCFSVEGTLLDEQAIKCLSLEIGLVDGQAIDVWQYWDKECALKAVSLCSNKLTIIRSIEEMEKSNRERFSLDTILSFFIKPVTFWEKKGEVVKAICLFREIQPSGEAGVFFKTTTHQRFAHNFHKLVKKNVIVHGDIITITNPEVFLNPVYKSDLISSGEPYFLEIGFEDKGNIAFCKVPVGGMQPENSCKEKPCLTQTFLASPQMKILSQSEYSSILSVSMKDASELSDHYLIPLMLLKPSKKSLDFHNLRLVSGYCYQSCNNMYMYSQIQWNTKQEPLCPECCIVLKLSLCLELDAWYLPSNRIVRVLLAWAKAEKFLEVSCKEFLEDNLNRVLTLKVLESKYVNGSEHKVFKLKVSDVSDLTIID